MIWIRSQDKKILMEIKKIEIARNKVIVGFNGNFETLGEYSTEEKALKVLDMIETHLEHLEYKVSGREIIFQMPADEEV